MPRIVLQAPRVPDPVYVKKIREKNETSPFS